MDEFLQVKQLEEPGGEQEEVCGACGNMVGARQRGIQCDGCDAWNHGTCEKISSEEYKYLSLTKNNVVL